MGKKTVARDDTVAIHGLYPASTERRPEVGLMLGHYLQRWPDIKPASGRRLPFAAMRESSLCNYFAMNPL